MMNAGVIAGAGARRGAFDVAVVETATNVFDFDSVGIVYNALVDDPAFGVDTIGVRVGEILEEAAAASTTLNAGTVYTVAVVEESHVTDLSSAIGPTVYSASVLEFAAADSAQSVPAPLPAITAMVAGLDPASVSSISSGTPSSRTLKSGTTVTTT